MLISVILPTHNPEPRRLSRTLDGLRAQTLPRAQWELLLVDNASTPAVRQSIATLAGTPNSRLVMEPVLGLSAARRRGLSEARGRYAVFVDDDNVLDPDYLQAVVDIFALAPRLGMAGGISVPEFESPPAEWQREFFSLLALRDLGPEPQTAVAPAQGTGQAIRYPICAPIGAGMALRREAAEVWLQAAAASPLSDRRGSALTSAGDNDIVLTLFKAGWHAGYFPTLRLTHLIPAGRLAPHYLARLNRGIQCSWMQVLARHQASPWPPIARWTLPFRQARAWLTYRAWTSPAARIRWAGACGHFAGRATNC